MRRPFLWVLGAYVVIFFCVFYFRGNELEKKEYIIPLGEEQMVPAVVTGTLERYEKKPKSYYLYLKSVTVTFADSWYQNSTEIQRKKYSFSDFLVITKESCEHRLYPGNVLSIQGKLMEFSSSTNPGNFDEKAYYREKNIYYQMQADSVRVSDKKRAPVKGLLFSVREHILSVYRTCLPGKDSGTVSAMLFGEKAEMELSVKELYRRNGIGHLLSISGLHISIICLFFSFLLSKFFIPPKAGFVLTAAFLYAYGYMAGLSVSVHRAILMMLFLLFSKVACRSYDALTAMAVSALVTLLQRPYAIFSGSFLLSYSAAFGAVYVTPIVKGLILGTIDEQEMHDRKRRQREKESEKNCVCPGLFQLYVRLKELILSSFLCSAAVTITTLPVLLFFFYEVPTYSIFLNVLVIPLAAVLILLSFIGGLTGLFCLPLAKGILFFSHLILRFYTSCCDFFGSLWKPVLILGCPKLFPIFMYFFVLLAIVYICGLVIRHREHFPVCLRLGCMICFIVVLCVLCVHIPERGVQVSVLDVGQGDGIVLQTEHGRSILIDGGSTSTASVGKYRILPFLKYNGIRTLDYMIMTHEDEDHISGQLELMETAQEHGIQIKMLLLPEPSNTSAGENYQKMRTIARKNGISVRYIHKGNLLRMDSISLYCLHPEKGFDAESANAYSTTLRLTCGDFSMLFTGDLEKNGEEAVLPMLEQTTVLKVAHHGSKNSSSEEYLDAISPKVAVISCGRKNRYGHPHKELLSRLQSVHAKVLRTDQGGAVLICSDGKRWSAKSWCERGL